MPSALGLPTVPTLGQQWPTVSPVREWDGIKWFALGSISAQSKALTVGSGLPTSGAVSLDLTALSSTVQTVGLTGDANFTTANRTAGLYLELVLLAGAASRTLTWPVGWQAFGAALPTTLAVGAVLRLAIECLGTADSDIDVSSALSV